MEVKQSWIKFIEKLQDDICDAVAHEDGTGSFVEDPWERSGGGGGKTRLFTNGAVFEKAGVNISTVFGAVTPIMKSQLKIEGEKWFACGLSLVLHPYSPMVPTVHANYRMFELYDAGDNLVDRWFGGGTDLTPYYIFEEDAIHFHKTYQQVCDGFDSNFYTDFKRTCDDYFVNTHRNNERRGIGGIFYDYKKPNENKDVAFWMQLAKQCGYAFMDAYLPIVNKRKALPFSEAQKYWQEIRRGRYVEFNLVHDRGTIFGLKTNGRTESILMSLPPTVRFDYDYQPAAGSEEKALLEVCMEPKNWLQIISDEERNAWAAKTNSC